LDEVANESSTHMDDSALTFPFMKYNFDACIPSKETNKF